MNDENQRREPGLDLKRTNNRDPQMSGTRTRARQESTRATERSTFNPSIFRHLYRWTNLAHKRADERPPGHPNQTKVSKIIPMITPWTYQCAIHTVRARAGRMVSPDRPSNSRQDSDPALGEREQTQEAEGLLEPGLGAQMLEVRVVRLDDVDLRAFRIGSVLDRLPGSRTRRAVPRLQRCRHMLGAGRVVREGLEGQRRVDRTVAVFLWARGAIIYRRARSMGGLVGNLLIRLSLGFAFATIGAVVHSWQIGCGAYSESTGVWLISVSK